MKKRRKKKLFSRNSIIKIWPI